MNGNDIASSDRDMECLAGVIKHGGLARCDLCEHAKPNAGYDSPYCMYRTKLGQGEKGRMTSSSCKGKPPFRLKKGNIPKDCEYWVSRKIADKIRAREYLERKIQIGLEEVEGYRKELREITTTGGTP